MNPRLPPPAPGWEPVSGTVRRGHGVASGTGPDRRYPEGTLRMQRPFFLALGLDLEGHHEGTINLDLAPRSWRFRTPDHVFPLVRWTDLHPPETFRFARIWIDRGPDRRPGWIYAPDPATKAAHAQPPSVVEIIAGTLPDLACGDVLTLWIRPESVEIRDPDALPGVRE